MKLSKRVVTWPFDHFGLKLLSLGLALLLWMVVSGDETVERGLRVPLELQQVPAGLELTGEIPATVDVRNATLFGLALDEVASVRVLMSDGSWQAVKLRRAKVGADEFKAFGVRLKTAALKKGIEPTAVVAFDASGVELGRQATGIG